VQVERRQGEHLAQLGRLGVAADVELEWWEGRVGGDVDVGGCVCLEEEGFERGEIDRGDLSVEQLRGVSGPTTSNKRYRRRPTCMADSNDPAAA
jgi:hypothetical protein